MSAASRISRRSAQWPPALTWAAAALMAAGLLLPAGVPGWWSMPGVGVGAAAGCTAAALAARRWPAGVSIAIGAAGLLAPAWSMLRLVHADPAPGVGAIGLWCFLAGWAIFAWACLAALSRLDGPRGTGWVPPALLGALILYLWEVLAVGMEVPRVLLPAPHAVGAAFAARLTLLWGDFEQTFLKSVLAGWAIGSAAGLAAALLADRFDALRRGLLPLATLAGAVPIIGIAPIMVMWFGFDWPSKAAVAAIVTFFPMFVNTLAGLASVDAMHRDLMRTYAATHAATLVKLRLPGAAPFIFNALKINSTLALIAAIVAEFFGSPTQGLGFRISTEVARMNVDVVWAAIAVSALAGSLFYGLIAVVERALTFWHPSYRS
jgi:NitT/TauT family transport system permease protein